MKKKTDIFKNLLSIVMMMFFCSCAFSSGAIRWNDPEYDGFVSLEWGVSTSNLQFRRSSTYSGFKEFLKNNHFEKEDEKPYYIYNIGKDTIEIDLYSDKEKKLYSQIYKYREDKLFYSKKNILGWIFELEIVGDYFEKKSYDKKGELYLFYKQELSGSQNKTNIFESNDYNAIRGEFEKEVEENSIVSNSSQFW